jgi:hypothetical protein
MSTALTLNAAMKMILAVAFALGLAGFGGASVAVSHAAPDTGTYDDYMDLALESCWGSVTSPVAWVVGDPGSVVCAHTRS